MSKEINVLFLDDEENIINSIRRLFMAEPYGVYVTTDAKEGLEVLDKENIKVVVSDQRMPNISGVEFLSQVKEKKPNIMRILFTGYTDLQAAEDAINIGEVYRFINKPWNGSDLKVIIQEAISHYDLISENKNLLQVTQSKNAELEEMNVKLSAMFEKQREFTSVVSHELRTPLASIKAAIDIVMSESSGELSDDQNNFLTKAKTNVDRLRRLINDILDLSKLESGKIQLKLEPNSIKESIKEAVDMNLAAAQQESLTLSAQVEESIPQIMMDSDRISQVLNNLINNAIKFTNEGGIVIRAKNVNDHVEIAVEDSGVGIDQSDVGKLFEKFSQIESAETCEKGGTGLGLAICKEIVNQHNGEIRVESEPNKGSKFIFTIPYKIQKNGENSDVI